MMMSEILLRFVGWGVATLFVFATAYLIYRPLKSESPSINLLVYLFLTIFSSSVFILITGLLGVLRANFLVSVSALGLVFYGVLPPIRHSLGDGWQTIRAFSGMFRNWWGALPKWVRWILCIFATYTTLRFLFLVIVLPPFVWDSLTYHLTNVAHWVQAGQIEVFNTPVTRIYSPSNYEVFATFFAVFLHHDAFIEASGIPAYVLAFVAIYAICRRIGLATWSSILGAVAYASTPALIIASTGTKNDPIMAAMYLMAIALVLEISRRRSMRSQTLVGSFILLLTLLFYALGTKTYIMHLGTGIIVLLFLSTWYEKSGENWSQLIRDIESQFRLRRYWLIVLFIIIVALAIFMGSYWYLRNWSHTGNPVYPYGVSIVGIELLDEYSGRANVISFGKLLENLETLGFKFWDRQFPIVPDLPNTTGWGWVAYGLGLVGSIWALVRRPRFRLIFVAFAVSLLTLYLTSTTSPWNMRYQIWVPALFSIALAAFMDWIPQEHRLARGTYIILFVVSLSLNLSMTVAYNRVSIEKFEQMLSLPLWSREASIFRINMPEEYEQAFNIVPEGDLLGYNLTGNGFVYPLYKSDFSQELIYIPFTNEDSCETIANKMRDAGTRWLFVAREHSEDANIGRLRACANEGTTLRERAKGLYVIQ